MDQHLFIFGFGYSSAAIAAKAAGQFATITGTTRSREKAVELTSSGIAPILFGKETQDTQLGEALKKATHLLISIAPDEIGDPVLNACQGYIAKAKNLKWIGYLSTVGVYGNHDGAWVDEMTICRPVSRRSIQRLAAENAWQDFANTQTIPLAIFRLSGIYGPGRNVFVNIEKGTSRRLVKPGQVFNRIHRDDIASAVSLAMAKNIGGTFNITDNEPAPAQDVVTFAHQLAGTKPPREADFETAELSSMARSFYGENKRVSNAKSKQVLGLKYAYPDYRTSLKRMWDEGSWGYQE